jgi:hypothetical protein
MDSGIIYKTLMSGAPQSPDMPTVIPEQSTFLLKWRDGDAGKFPVKGHLIQAKRVGTSAEKQPLTFVDVKRQRRDADLSELRPRHVVGEWFTISNVMGQSDNEHRIR